MRKVISAKKIFDGFEWFDDHSIIIEDEVVSEITSSRIQPTTDYGLAFIAPSFIDLQIYGAYSKLFSVFPEPGTLALLHKHCLEGGTTLFLPTVATNTKQVVFKCIDAVREYWQQGGKGVGGLHLEGPWINPVKRGAHTATYIHPPTIGEVKELLDHSKGVVKMITVAPEVCSREILQLLKQNNIVISAGHSDATFEEANAAFDNGITTVTHLYNAMSPLHHRAPGLTGAALLNEHVCASIIADGYHVDFNAIAIAKKIMKERLFVITDAVTATTEGPYQHQLNIDRYECNNTLSGSAISMHQSFVNLVQHVGIEMGEALRMCSLYPAQIIGSQQGRIAPGSAAQFVVLDKQLRLVDVVSG